MIWLKLFTYPAKLTRLRGFVIILLGHEDPVRVGQPNWAVRNGTNLKLTLNLDFVIIDTSDN